MDSTEREYCRIFFLNFFLRALKILSFIYFFIFNLEIFNSAFCEFYCISHILSEVLSRAKYRSNILVHKFYCPVIPRDSLLLISIISYLHPAFRRNATLDRRNLNRSLRWSERYISGQGCQKHFVLRERDDGRKAGRPAGRSVGRSVGRPGRKKRKEPPTSLPPWLLLWPKERAVCAPGKRYILETSCTHKTKIAPVYRNTVSSERAVAIN